MEKRSSSVFRIDENVFYSMGLMAVICLIVLGFSYKNHESCENIIIETNSANYLAKSLISFKAKTQAGRRYEWYFGDNSKPETTSGPSVTHEFKSAGRYTVTLIVNDRCDQVINVDIKEEPFVINTELAPQISGPDTAYIDQAITFKETNPEATSWEWRVDNSKIEESNTKEVTYNFNTEGFHEVYVRINGRFVGIKEIYVKDPKPLNEDNSFIAKPHKKATAPLVIPPMKNRPDAPPLTDGGGPPHEEPKPKVEPKAVRDITPDEVSILLEGVVTGKKDVPDFAEFLCGDLNITVKYNGKQMSFNRMCNELKEFKKAKKIEKPIVVLAKDKETNCIKTMVVTVEKKGIFGRMLNK